MLYITLIQIHNGSLKHCPRLGKVTRILLVQNFTWMQENHLWRLDILLNERKRYWYDNVARTRRRISHEVYRNLLTFVFSTVQCDRIDLETPKSKRIYSLDIVPAYCLEKKSGEKHSDSAADFPNTSVSQGSCQFSSR